MAFKWFKRAPSSRGAEDTSDDVELARIESGAWIADSIETLAFVMRTYGHGGYDIETRNRAELVKECEGWSEHLLGGGGPSDWRSLRGFFRGARAAEHEFVDVYREKTKDFVAEIVGGLRGALSGDETADATVAATMEELKAAADASDLDALRRCADKAVNAVGSAMRERSERHRAELKRMALQVAQMQGDLAAAKFTAQIDGLTQVYNRAGLDSYLERVVATAGERGEPICLLMVDIDEFKPINDTYGHRTGDIVLQAVADALVNTCRSGSSFVARYGGDEFAVVLERANLQGGQSVASRLLEATRAIVIESASELKVTISVGAAELRGGDTVEDWLVATDEALYRAKRGGRNRAA